MKLFLLVTVFSYFMIGCGSSQIKQTDKQRYRGQLVLGHERQSFCPEGSRRCYWLGPSTDPEVKQALLDFVAQQPGELHAPVCVVVDGVIDEQTKLKGQARKHDGYFIPSRLKGLCEDGNGLSLANFQNKNFTLIQEDGRPIYNHNNVPLPELKFSENMTVEGISGCQKFTALAQLVENDIEFSNVEFEENTCPSGQESYLTFTPRHRWQVSFLSQTQLLLKRKYTYVIFELSARP